MGSISSLKHVFGTYTSLVQVVRENTPDKTVNQTNTTLMGVDGSVNQNSKNDLTQDLYFEDDYVQLHNDYLKSASETPELMVTFDVLITTFCPFPSASISPGNLIPSTVM